MASLFAPAFTVAVRMNPLWSALGAGMLGPSLVNDLGGEVRQFTFAEMNRTSITIVAAALVAVSEYSRRTNGSVRSTSRVGAGDDARHDRAARQRRLAEAIPHATIVMIEGDHAVCISDPARFSAKAAGSVPGHPDGVIRLNRSAIRRQLPDEPRTAPDGG